MLSNYQLYQLKGKLKLQFLDYGEEDGDWFNKATESLQIVIKYQEIIKPRVSLNQLYQINDLPALNTLFNNNRLLKSHLYKQSFSLDQCLDRLSPERLQSLSTCKSMNDLLDKLIWWQQKACQAMIEWEKLLKEKIAKHNWRDYLFDYGKRSVESLYRYSFIGLGAEVLGMISKIGIDAIKNTAIARDFPAIVQVAESHGIKSAKYIGGALGLLITGMNGANGLLRLLLTLGTGTAMNALIESINILDKKASVLNTHVDHTTAMRLASMTISTMESFLTSQETPAWFVTLGAIMGNILFTESGKQLTSYLPADVRSSMNEPMMLMMISLALLGQEYGSEIAVLGYRGWDKYHSRTNLEKELCQLILSQDDSRGCQITFPNNHLQWSFWTKPNDAARLEWTQGKQYFEVHCDSQKINSQERSITCETPIEFERLPVLGRK